ncbi:MAG: hypothetical protein IPP87_06735 [Ideonella sp.]|nr:hypothetical protein [Ideonella sp.]
MRLAAATITASLAWAACSSAGPARPVPIELGTAFSLRAGESTQTLGGALRVGFEGVSVDSRCPKGEQCVWAGDATARVWLQQGGGAKDVRELHTASGAAQAATALGHRLRLVRLEPYPVTGRVIVKEDYVVTLMLSRGAMTEVEADR